MAVLPKQVERDLQEIAEYEQQLAAEKAPAAPQTETSKPEAQTPPAPEVKPETPPKPAESAAPEVKPEVKHDAAYWEKRFQTVQGMFDAEVRPLRDQNKVLLAQVQTMQEQIASLQKPEVKQPAKERLVSEKDVAEYGVELIDVQRRVAQEVFNEHVVPLQEEIRRRDTEIKELVQALNKTDNAVNTMSFEQRLALAVPDFNQINADPVWIAYLEEPDPYTGEPRRVFAEFAYNNGLVDKVKQVVTHFKSTIGQKPNTPTAEETERAQRQAELDRQITPTRTNSQPTTTPSVNTRMYTEQNMVDGFAQVRKLNAAGKYDDAAKLEAELSLAYMENRVRG